MAQINPLTDHSDDNYIPPLHQSHELQTRPQVTESVSQVTLQDYFRQHQHELDQVELSCIAVRNTTLAQQLYEQMQQGASFDDLAHLYACPHSWTATQLDGPLAQHETQRLNWWALRDELKEAIASTPPGTVMQPIAINQRWYLIRVEAFLPAILEGELEQQLRLELFEQWLVETTETLPAQATDKNFTAWT
ncbi:MAG: peptidylprolyl isomerase [Oculatellaceae cyanobacterium bins.114]|nr:peptidylprolyl isomerase [Oculatellaceae cyanobacterium bins.114]